MASKKGTILHPNMMDNNPNDPVFTDGNSLIEDFSANGLSKYDRG